jgi:hypothetical protein
MLTDGDAALPPDCTVTLIGDRPLPRAALIDACRAVGWDALFRLSTDARQGSTVRLSDATPRPLWDLVTGPGPRVTGAVALVRTAGGGGST